MRSGRDWHRWYRAYDDPASSLSHRLDVVRTQLDDALARLDASGPAAPTLVSLCAGDGRDTLPVLARRPDRRLRALLVELDATLADAARESARDLGLDDVLVRSADAGHTRSFADFCPADVLLLCGVFGNITDADVERTVGRLPMLLTPGATVIWTRGRRVGRGDPSAAGSDPSERVRDLFTASGFDETAFVRPPDMAFRVGVNTLRARPARHTPTRLFRFVDGS